MNFNMKKCMFVNPNSKLVHSLFIPELRHKTMTQTPMYMSVGQMGNTEHLCHMCFHV